MRFQRIRTTGEEGDQGGECVCWGATQKKEVLHEHEWTGAFEEWLQDPPICIIKEVLHEHEWTGAFEEWLQDPPICIIAESQGQLAFLFQESFQPCGKACNNEYLAARVPLRLKGGSSPICPGYQSWSPTSKSPICLHTEETRGALHLVVTPSLRDCLKTRATTLT